MKEVKKKRINQLIVGDCFHYDCTHKICTVVRIEYGLVHYEYPTGSGCFNTIGKFGEREVVLARLKRPR